MEGRRGPGRVGDAASAAGAAYFFLPPRGSWQFDFRSGIQVEQIMLLGQASSTIVEMARSFIAADAYAVWRGQGATGTWRVVSSSGIAGQMEEF